MGLLDPSSTYPIDRRAPFDPRAPFDLQVPFIESKNARSALVVVRASISM